MLVVLDPGHNNRSVNRSPDGACYEWEFAQDVADRAEVLIGCIPGLDCVKTKEADTYPTSLAMRTDLANDVGADLFLSIHSNAYGSGGWTSPKGMGFYIYPGKDYRLAQVARMVALQHLPFNDRGIRERNFHVLRESKMPSLLYEFGFHTNREDVERLKQPRTRELCALVVAKTACAYFDIMFTECGEGEEWMTKKHIVVSGDAMWRIARENDLELAELVKYNPHIIDPAHIEVGDIVYLGEPSQLEKDYAKLNRESIFL